MAYRGIERPKIEEDEDELLRLNQSFAAAPPAKPAAGSVRMKQTRISVPEVTAWPARGPGISFEDDDDESAEPVPAKKRSLFAERRARRDKAQLQHDHGRTGTEETNRPRRGIESADMNLGLVLSDIVEKEPAVPNLPVRSDSALSITGFPAVVHRSERAPKDQTKRHTQTPAALFTKATVPESIEGGNGVHEENLRTLESMSMTEIEEAQAEIRAKLDPSLIAMLEARASKKYGEPTDSEHSRTKRSQNESNIKSAVKELSKESEIEMTVLPQPLSNAVSQLKGKVDGGNLPDLSWIPQDQLEYEKLEWTADLPDDQQPPLPSQDASDLRFGFSGEVIEMDKDIPHHHGLHHHGDEPMKAGYSVDELLSLSRSTAPSQRALALRILATIVANLYNNVYSPLLSRPLAWVLIRKNYLLHLRVALDDTHETVLASSLAGIAASLGCGSLITDGEELCWDELARGRLGHRVFAISVASQEFFRVRATGIGKVSDEVENDGSLEGVTSLMRRDAISGLLASNILARFSYLMQTRELPVAVVNDVLSILTRVCRHSQAASQQVAECNGLVQIIHGKFISAPWPPINSESGYERLAALKVVRMLCQSDVEVAMSLIKFGIVHDAVGYAFVNPKQLPSALKNLGWQLQAETWFLLNVLFSMRLSASVFDEYRGPLFEAGRLLFATSSPSEDDLDSPMDTTKIMYLRMLTALLTAFGEMLDVGGSDDGMQPFIDLAFIPTRSYSCSHVWDFLAAYGRCLIVNNCGKAEVYLKRVAKLFEAHDINGDTVNVPFRAEVWSELHKATAGVVNSASMPLGQHFVGLHDRSRVDAARALVRLNQFYDGFVSFLEILGGLNSASPEWDKFTESLLSHPDMQRLVLRIIEGSANLTTVGDWIRCFLPGEGALLYGWLASKNMQGDLVTNCAVALAALPLLLPGDEFMAGRLLNMCILHPRVQEALAISAGVPLREADKLSMSKLQDLLDYGLYSDAALQKSEALYGRRTHQVTTLLTEGSASSVSMPARNDWMFSPFQRLLMESQQFGHLIAEARKMGKLREDGDDLVVECLRLIDRIETCIPFDWYRRQLPDAVKIARLMCIFLLPSSTSAQEIFALDSVSAMLSAALVRYTSDESAWERYDLDKACGGKSRFYHLYQSLVEQFAAVSFGDVVFARYLLLPISMRYPVDYRELFWNELYDILPAFTMDMKNVAAAGEFLDYFEPIESEEKIVLMYIRAIADRKVTLNTTPLLFHIAVHHVSGLLFGEEHRVSASRTNVGKQVTALLGQTTLDCIVEWGGITTEGDAKERVSGDALVVRRAELQQFAPYKFK
ncbi:hypothetical protein DFJ77DRAFT_453408 [Powellomyces hirtus]|nr:hypothetical protein DFJ77DRAFT_453408 [Powellomyces hirtus]